MHAERIWKTRRFCSPSKSSIYYIFLPYTRIACSARINCSNAYGESMRSEIRRRLLSTFGSFVRKLRKTPQIHPILRRCGGRVIDLGHSFAREHSAVSSYVYGLAECVLPLLQPNR